MIDEAKLAHPAAVVLDRESEMRSYAKPILNYVHSAFRLHDDFGEIKIYSSEENSPK